MAYVWNLIRSRPDFLFSSALSFALLITIASCSSHRPKPIGPASPPYHKSISRIDYSIQVGAFRDVSNASRLCARLKARGIWAFYFRSPSGLYKVRFGNYPSKKAALNAAQALKSKGIIGPYYIVSPERYASLKERISTELRKKIVGTARSFMGVPYRWGGSSPGTGFDCSGFTMAVYQLNGLLLPRSSYRQWMAGTPVPKTKLKEGDLVFFATSGRGRVSHVGIYVGDGKFIHAPGKGKRIKISSLYNPYFKPRFMGARSYF